VHRFEKMKEEEEEEVQAQDLTWHWVFCVAYKIVNEAIAVVGRRTNRGFTFICFLLKFNK
jgi:phage terminase small subunit